MNTIEYLLKELPAIEGKLHYTFHDKALLVLAFVHRSYINEHREVLQHNEPFLSNLVPIRRELIPLPLNKLLVL